MTLKISQSAKRAGYQGVPVKMMVFVLHVPVPVHTERPLGRREIRRTACMQGRAVADVRRQG